MLQADWAGQSLSTILVRSVPPLQALQCLQGCKSTICLVQTSILWLFYEPGGAEDFTQYNIIIISGLSAKCAKPYTVVLGGSFYPLLSVSKQPHSLPRTSGKCGYTYRPFWQIWPDSLFGLASVLLCDLCFTIADHTIQVFWLTCLYNTFLLSYDCTII